MAGQIVVVGDALLDRDWDGRVERLSPEGLIPVVDEPSTTLRPGGAALAAALAASDGRNVTLVTALARDDAATELRAALDASGVETIDLGFEDPTASTVEKLRVRSEGRSLLRVDRGQGGTVGHPGDQARRALASAAAVLVADYGRGVTAETGVRSALQGIAARVPLVWDPHPRGPWPVPQVRLATPNAQEAVTFAGGVGGDGLEAFAERGRRLRRQWQATAVAVTLSRRGALLVEGDGPPTMIPTTPARGDVCGAGDRFASAAAGFLADGALPSEAVSGAVVSASAFVAAGGASAVRLRHEAEPMIAPQGGMAEAQAVISRTRARRGKVVATGGCFDLLHAGHISLLRQARALGDCLVVCLNSDASVRRIKGPGRPLVPEEDRAAVLRALEFVDAVVIFDEDTPVAVLNRIRPDIFAKGADYAVSDLPEAKVVASWGGEAVLLPYLKGRSTTSLMHEAARRIRTSA